MPSAAGSSSAQPLKHDRKREVGLEAFRAAKARQTELLRQLAEAEEDLAASQSEVKSGEDLAAERERVCKATGDFAADTTGTGNAAVIEDSSPERVRKAEPEPSECVHIYSD